MLYDCILLIETFKPILLAAWTGKFFVAFYFDYFYSWYIALTVSAKNCVFVYTFASLLVEVKCATNTSTE